MKKLLFLGLAVAATLFYQNASAQAARGFAQKLPLQAGDTVTNTGTITRLLPSLSGGYSGYQIQVVDSSLTGTNAGTLELLGSLDNIHFNQVDSTRVILPWRHTPIFNIVGPPLNYYELVRTGSGTMESTWTIWYRTPIYQISY